MKLELGAGLRPTRGYEHHDAWAFPHIEHVCDPWMLHLPDNSVDEVLALAFIEHLTYDQAADTFRNIARMLKPDGLFLFDVPDYPTWVRYYQARLVNPIGCAETVPDMDHIRRTLFGWGRWPGDTHSYGWDLDHLCDTLEECGLTPQLVGDVDAFAERAYRRRFSESWDAHIYMTATPT